MTGVQTCALPIYYLESNAMEIVADRIQKKQPDIICGSIEYFSENSDNRYVFKYTPQESENEYRKKRMGIVHPATIVARQIYDKYGLYDSRFYISADMDWFLRIRENNIPIDFIDIKLSNMSDEGISSQSNNVKKRIHDWNILFTKHTKNKIEYWRFMIHRIVTYYKTFIFK